ncbi:MAG: glycosyltransferase [Planctomycetota bacterium]
MDRSAPDRSSPMSQTAPARTLDAAPAVDRGDTSPAVRTFDGVLCFGGVDWWYHNRGHYDLQMMRELSASMPVVYVNSIGMRVPRPGKGGMFARRVARKLKSFSRGLVRVRERFWVLSPVVAPAGLGAGANAAALTLQVRRAARRAGIERPLVWVACPPAEPVVDRLEPAGVVYQRTDRFEEFRGVDRARIAAFDVALKDRADATLFCSSWLMEQERDQPRAAVFVDHGVDADRFEDAGSSGDGPADTAALPRPLVGFVGGIDAHTFDPELFVETARALPDATFMLVGACSLPEGWCPLDNVHLLGQRPYDEVAGYMAAADALIMPWNQSEWIRACNPVKLKEYLAVGRPIVSTPFPELARYGELVRVASTPTEFAAQIRRALDEPHDAAPGRDLVREQTWTAKADAVLDALELRGLQPEAAR